LQAVIEKVSLKQEIFSDLEKICPPHCILATNTSTIDLNIIGEKISSQDRVVGAHFFRLLFNSFLLFPFLFKGKQKIIHIHTCARARSVLKDPVVNNFASMDAF
jgi:hypothetical protein